MSLQMRKTMVLASDELPSTTQNSTFLWDDILYKSAMKTQYAQDCELIVAFTRKICLRGTRIGWAAITTSIHSFSIASDHQLHCFLHFFGSLSPPPPLPLSTFFQCWYWCWFTSCSLTQTWNLSKNDQRIKFQVLILREALKKGIFRNIS